MKTITQPRKRWSPAQRAEILQACQASGLTQKEFVAQAGVGLSTLANWRRKAKADNGGGASFLALPNLFGAAGSPPTYRLQLPRGLSLEVRSGFDPEELGRWLDVLGVV